MGMTNFHVHSKVNCALIDMNIRPEFISGWWLTYPSEKYDWVNGKDYPLVNWHRPWTWPISSGNYSSNPYLAGSMLIYWRVSHIWWTIKNVPDHQPDMIFPMKTSIFVGDSPAMFDSWLATSYPIFQYDRIVSTFIWENYNISLTWIKTIWGWFPLLTMIPVRSQWGRYNLPTFMDFCSMNSRFIL